MAATARSTSSPTELPNEKGIKFGGPEVMKSVNNIWKISDKGGKPVQVTKHTDGNLFFPSISADGKTIVYEENFGLWKLDVATGKSSEIRIDIKSRLQGERNRAGHHHQEAEGFSLSPSNKRAAVVGHGEIFTIATDRGRPQRVTRDALERAGPALVAQTASGSPSSRDRSGREEDLHLRRIGQEP